MECPSQNMTQRFIYRKPAEEPGVSPGVKAAAAAGEDCW